MPRGVGHPEWLQWHEDDHQFDHYEQPQPARDQPESYSTNHQPHAYTVAHPDTYTNADSYTAP